MACFLGIDPGMSGGLALVGGVVLAVAMPETERDVYNLLMDWKVRYPIEFALIERVHSMPKQGVASSFKFGVSYGFLRGILIASGIPFGEITPQSWQKLMGCRSGGNKNITKARAQQLYPSIRITHATADALLIGEVCRRMQFQIRGAQEPTQYQEDPCRLESSPSR